SRDFKPPVHYPILGRDALCMFASEETIGGLRSPYPEGARSISKEPLHRGTVPAGHRSAGKEFKVHCVETARDRALASELLNRMYDWRGYGANHALDAADNSNTFAVSVGGEIICTLTLTVDSGAGLAADRTFRDVLAEA